MCWRKRNEKMLIRMTGSLAYPCSSPIASSTILYSKHEASNLLERRAFSICRLRSFTSSCFKSTTVWVHLSSSDVLSHWNLCFIRTYLQRDCKEAFSFSVVIVERGSDSFSPTLGELVKFQFTSRKTTGPLSDWGAIERVKEQNIHEAAQGLKGYSI